MSDGEWQELGLCRQVDPELFFPEKGGSTREAKRVCWSCEVRAECLDFALAGDERFGIWGGLSERERRKLVKGRGAVDPAWDAEDAEGEGTGHASPSPVPGTLPACVPLERKVA